MKKSKSRVTAINLDKPERKRGYSGVFYVESCPEDFFSELESSGVSCAYILHDSDIDDDGVLKKPHYHILYFYENAVYPSGVIKLHSLSGCKMLEYIGDSRKASRYLCHLDDEDKFQYPVDSICYLNGGDKYVLPYLSDYPQFKLDLLTLQQFITKNHCRNINALYEEFGDDPDYNYLLSRYSFSFEARCKHYASAYYSSSKEADHV